MIITEQITIDDREFTRTYSDAGRYVIRDGISYEDAIDPSEFNRTYIEGELIPTEMPTDEDYQQIGKIMMGVSE